MKKIRVLICDDSALMRRSLSKIVESDQMLEVAGTARDGQDSVNKARELRPDVITMDVNMPGMDGITALQIIVNEGIAPVLMVSSLTQEGAVVTFESMALGAFDYVSKPGGTVTFQMGSAAREIVSKIKAASSPGVLKKLTLRRMVSLKSKTDTSEKDYRKKKRDFVFKLTPRTGPGFKAVAIGVSTGGPKNLFDVLPFLPEDLPAAVFVVQHMPGKFITPYARRIDSQCKMRCVEAEAGMIARPGNIYLAKGEHHMTLFHKLNGDIIIRTPVKPDHLFMPSVDIMMDSVSDVFKKNTIGVLMTGMGKDGAESMLKIKKAGGITIAESEESAIVFGMPAEAIKLGGVDIIAPSWEIAENIIKAVE